MTPSRRIVTGACALAMVLILVGADVPAAEPASGPDVAEILAKIDKALFFHDRQKRLAGYEVRLSKSQTVILAGMPAGDPGESEADGKLAFDAAKGKTQQDAAGEAVPAGAFTPFCGPWTLTELMAFEIELFAEPFSRRFDAKRYDRAVSRQGKGHRLTLTPKSVGKGDFLAPTITKIVLELDASGVPRKASLDLSQAIMQEKGTLEFEYTKGGTRQRIRKIKSRIPSANFEIRPELTFSFAKVKEFVLPSSVRFEIWGGHLSGAMRNMTHVSIRTFEGYAVRKGK